MFKAETRNGEPVWNLTKEKMTVKENTQDCEVISVAPITQHKPLNICLVIDHSGSMDGGKMYINDSIVQVEPSALDNAKAAVKTFISTFNEKKDNISIIGFSDTVDKVLPLPLTDGFDNASHVKWNEVVALANKAEVPIYIVGLGSVNGDTLSMIAKSTKGQYYYTNSSSSLNVVYQEISKQVQAFYELTYKSTNLTDTTRDIELSFNIDSIYLVTNQATENFPPALVAFEESRAKYKQRQQQIPIYGGIAVILLAAAGTIVCRYQKKKVNTYPPAIVKLFPNPAKGNISLIYASSPGQLQIMNVTGKLAKSIPLSGNETMFDIADLPNGNYIAIIQAGRKQSNAVPFIVQR